MICRDSKGRASFGPLEYFIQVLIVISLVSIAVETLPQLPPRVGQILRIIEFFTVVVFSAEYVARLIASKPSIRYVFSFYGLIDLVAILPFYLSAGVDLRSVRAFRLLRLFRLLKLTRYSAAVRRFHRAFLIAKEELLLFGAAAIIVLYLSAVGIYYFENTAQPEKYASVFHSLWWAIATLTTVGYGDVYPVTIGGKVFTFIVLVIGLGVVAVPTGLVAAALSKAREEEKASGEEATQESDKKQQKKFVEQCD